MNGWVIVILHDGPVAMKVFGPFTTRTDAEAASAVFPRQRARYSVYITQIEKM